MQEVKQLWEFKYIPEKFEDLVLNDNIKPKLKKALTELPNLMLYGPPGIGKGSFANVLLEHTGYDYLWINASDETGIDMIREKVSKFSSSLGITEMKIVIMNESDSLSQGAQGAQKMLKQLMEDVQSSCRFIFLTNDLSLMMDELVSRCRVIEFSNPPKAEIGKLCLKILKKEKIKYDKKVLISIIEKCYPDIRKIIGAVQNNIVNGELKNDDVSTFDRVFKEILEFMVKNDLESIRHRLRSFYIDYVGLYNFLYENIDSFKSPGGAIMLIGEHLRDHRPYPIKEINFMRMVVRMIHKNVL